MEEESLRAGRGKDRGEGRESVRERDDRGRERGSRDRATIELLGYADHEMW